MGWVEGEEWSEENEIHIWHKHYIGLTRIEK